MAGPVAIRTKLAAAAAALVDANGDAVFRPEAVLDHEPSQSRLPKLPCLTMAFAGFEQIDDETGPAQTVRWHYDVYLYVGFSDGDRAQVEMETIVPLLASIVRTDPGLGGSCAFARWTDSAKPPELGADDRWLRKQLHLVAEREEI